MSIKRSFFVLTLIWLLVGCTLGFIGFFGLERLNRGNDVSMEIGNDTFAYENQQKGVADDGADSSRAIIFFQVAIPILCIICSIILADVMFYCIKIKKPIKNLLAGANKIKNNDLNFTIKGESPDELGELCTAFEKMRFTMQETIETLWKEAEERKRLNAAFSHDLRNPITILKGEMAVVKKGIESGYMDDKEILEALSSVSKNIQRIEKYVEVMSSTRKLEAAPFLPKLIDVQKFNKDLKNHVQMLIGNTAIKVKYDIEISGKAFLFLDLDIFCNILDNIIMNDLRYAKTCICLKIRTENGLLHMSVQDDGSGFSDYIIKQGRE